jgi:hypothetical protein
MWATSIGRADHRSIFIRVMVVANGVSMNGMPLRLFFVATNRNDFNCHRLAR